MRRSVLLPVRDDGDDNVEHDEGAEEDEGDEVEVGDGGPAPPLRVRDVQFAVLTYKTIVSQLKTVKKPILR
jgi:hypothetical protein